MVVNVLYYLRFSHLNLWSREFECYIVNGESADCKYPFTFLRGEDASLGFSWSFWYVLICWRNLGFVFDLCWLGGECLKV